MPDATTEKPTNVMFSKSITWPDLWFGPINLWSMPKIMSVQEGSTEYEKLIYTNEEKFYQLKLTVSEFREKYYFNLRKYFQSYEGDYVPSREGVSMELSLENIYGLLDGLLDILSQAEGEEIIAEYYNKVKARNNE